jgi:MATE family multidrug resistance protein
MGWFGEFEIAANGIVLSLASVSFMVPLGLSTAAAVRVGHAVGAGDPQGMRRAARVALGLGAAVMGGFGLLFVGVPALLLAVFSEDPEVLALALTFMPLAAGFQMFDGLQVVASGVLRGVGDVRVPMLANFVGYWVLALPLGVLWARRWGGGPAAMWWALGGALAFVAVVLVLRVRNKLAGDIRRIDLDGPRNQPSVEPAPS